MDPGEDHATLFSVAVWRQTEAASLDDAALAAARGSSVRRADGSTVLRRPSGRRDGWANRPDRPAFADEPWPDGQGAAAGALPRHPVRRRRRTWVVARQGRERK